MTRQGRACCLGALACALFQSGCLLVLDRSRREQRADAGRVGSADAGRDAAGSPDAAFDAGPVTPCRATSECGAGGWARCTSSFEGTCEACSPTFADAVMLTAPTGVVLRPGTLRMIAEPRGALHVLITGRRAGELQPYLASVDPAAPTSAELAWLGERWGRYLTEAAFATGGSGPPVIAATGRDGTPWIEGSTTIGPEGPFRELALPIEELLGSLVGPPVGSARWPVPRWFWIRSTDVEGRLLGWVPQPPDWIAGPAVDLDARLHAVVYDSVLYESGGGLRGWGWQDGGTEFPIELPSALPTRAWMSIAPGDPALVAYPNDASSITVAVLALSEDQTIGVDEAEALRSVAAGLSTPTAGALAPLDEAGSALALTDGRNIVLIPLDGQRRPHERYHPEVGRLSGDVFVHRSATEEVGDVVVARVTAGDAPGVAVAALLGADRVLVRTMIGCAP